MKRLLLVLALLGGLTLGFAEDTATEDTVTIDEQITQIENAPEQERVQLMNQFKLRIQNMNQEQRDAAITQLQTRMQTRVQDRTAQQELQMQQSGEMIQTRTMNQNRVANQYRTQMPEGTMPEGSMPTNMMGGR